MIFGRIELNPLTTTERNALTSVADGEMVYNETDQMLQIREGGAWVDVLPSMVNSQYFYDLQTSTETTSAVTPDTLHSWATPTLEENVDYEVSAYTLFLFTEGVADSDWFAQITVDGTAYADTRRENENSGETLSWIQRKVFNIGGTAGSITVSLEGWVLNGSDVLQTSYSIFEIRRLA